MSGMILCRTKTAKNPFYISEVGVDIYTLEELCYYIYHNIYIITNDFVNEGLLNFIEKEVDEPSLAGHLRSMKQANAEASLAEQLVMILKYVDYYNVAEIEQIKDVLQTLGSQNVFERLKARADSFLNNQCFYSAIENYLKIIEGGRDPGLSGLFYAKVYHNTGIAYANMFLYSQAAEYFEQAYKIGQHETSHKCYLAALRLAQGENYIESLEPDEHMSVVIKEIESCMDNARYSDEYRQLQNIDNLKEKGQVAEYYQAIQDCVGMWKKQYEKFTS